MQNSEDARFTRTENAICDALATLLLEQSLDTVTMSALARKARISRSTLYAHCGNVMDAYRALVKRFYQQTETLDDHFSCPGCREQDGIRPFCERLRHAGAYRGTVEDGRFMPTTLAEGADASDGGYREKMRAAGIDDDIADAVFRFQMSGCYAVATSEIGRRPDWERYQEALDRFISGGMQALGVTL